MTTETTQVYVVRDASGEYIKGRWNDDGEMVASGRTPASNEACEFATRGEAEAACERATDKVLSRDAE